jgi:uncharacterized membrane protein YccF (DUF307 family)
MLKYNINFPQRERGGVGFAFWPTWFWLSLINTMATIAMLAIVPCPITKGTFSHGNYYFIFFGAKTIWEVKQRHEQS